MNVDEKVIKRYGELADIQKHTLLTEAELEEYIQISTTVLYDLLNTEETKVILNRLRNR